jgi:ElaB/YqjD/DUF883 family membrane-anchored ribosome-binding protein
MADNDPTTRSAANGAGSSHATAATTAATTSRRSAATARRKVADIAEDVSEAVGPDAETLDGQVAQLREDMRSIATTLTRMGTTAGNELKSQAQAGADGLTARGQSALNYAQDEFGAIEKQLKDTIREKPLTAVASAVALGFVLAVLTR